TMVIPTSGRAVVGGIDVIAHPALAKQAIGVVPQHNTLDRALTVWENLYFHGRFFGMSARNARMAADELLETFHLARWGKAAIMDHGRILALDTPARLKATVGADTIVVVSAEGDLDALGDALVREVGGAIGSTVVDATLRLQVQGASGVLPDVVTAAERNGFQ